MGSAYAGCVLRQVASQALNRNSQDVIFMPRQLSSLNVINRLISGEFSIPKIAGLSALDKFNMSLTFLGPWSPQVPIITVVSPQGIKYGSRQGENVIAQKWSQNVSILKPRYSEPRYSEFRNSVKEKLAPILRIYLAYYI